MANMLLLFVIVLSIHLNFTFGNVLNYDEEYLDSEQDYAIDSEKQDLNRIIGGQPADIEDYPYQCCFVVIKSHFCGCAIIHSNFILTAAHCTSDVKPEQVVLRAGSSNRTNGKIIPIKKITVHHKYNERPYDSDIAVMETKEPIQFDRYTQPISLPKYDHKLVPGSMVTLTGWGRTYHGAPSIPEQLMVVNTKVVNRRLCNRSYYNIFTENMFCAGNFLIGGKGVCQGDSGGPAAQDGFIVGLTSFGMICGQPLAPSVFTDLTAPDIISFIKEVMKF